MYSRLARTSLGALAALLSICTVATTAHADAKSAAKCSGAIIKAGAAIVQAEAKILQKCRETTLKGKVCDAVKTQASIEKARAKLTSTIVKACQGKDKTCNTEDADGSQPTLTEIGWNIGTCPGFEAAGCANAITDCDDIPVCLQCIAEASVNQAIDLYYPPNRPASTGDKVLNKCQAAIGKAALGYLGARSKNLSKCWGSKIKTPANACPAGAAEKNNAAKAKLAATIAKACPGLDNSTIGLPAGCLAVTPEGAGSCGSPVASVTDVSTCVGCVTDFKVDCPDRASSASVGATYPAGCLVVPPTPTPTVTPTPTATPTLTAGAPTPTVTFTPNILCGNGQIDGNEVCDLGNGSPQTTCPNTTFPCNANTCTCDCPTKVSFAGDATSADSILDTGWTGIAHRAPIISDGAVTVALACSPVGRPCGVCNVSGPIANTQAGEIDSQRCTNDTSIKCTTNTPCQAGGGTCQFFFGSTLPLAAGGVGTCVVNQFNGAVTGTANVETGDAVTVANLSSKVFTGPTDHPCPRCSDAGGINDGVAGGTCDDGPRVGLACDANGTVPSRPDFGRTSLDCPPAAGLNVATLPIDLSNSTGTVTKTLSSSSPNCGDGSGEKCLCETCNNAAATPCGSNADCVAVGATICGGRRCLGGTNDGGVCNNDSACPSGGLCGKAGEPSKPSACLDDTATAGVLDCTDTAPVDQEGECTAGPVTKTCTVASGHGQRSCGVDSDCGGGAGTCAAGNRSCFLTGGFTGKVGTNTLIAEGQADTPVNDVASPKLAAVFCVGATTASAVNGVAGLPAPGRVTIRGTAVGLP